MSVLYKTDPKKLPWNQSRILSEKLQNAVKATESAFTLYMRHEYPEKVTTYMGKP